MNVRRAMMRRAVILLAFSAGTITAQEGEGPDHARLRWEYFYRQRAYPFADIVPGALERARVQLRAPGAGLRVLGAPPIGGSRWEPIGPTSINGVNIGRISTIAVHPAQQNTIYIGGAQGGVWKTTDGGTNWAPLTDRECSLAMGSIVIDPANPEIVYAGTGEQHFSGDSYYGCGVLRSTDGGATWTQLGGGNFVRARISRLILVPSTAGNPASTTLLAASDNGLWRSTNGGTSWTMVRSGIHTDLVIDPTNEQVMYAALRSTATGAVYKSVDGGVTWTVGAGIPTGGTLGRINIAIARSAPATLYAAVHNNSTGALAAMYRSTDAGVNWSAIPASGASCGTQCWYDMFVAVHPLDANIVFFGGLSLYRSTNGGQSFSVVGANIHVDQHYLTFDPQDPQRVYVANDGGVFRSTDGGSSWTGINNGLAITQFYAGIALHPSDQTVVIAGTQDNGTLAYSGAPGWNAVIGGDGGFAAIDHENPWIRYGETQWQVPSTFSGPRRSDGGAYVRKVNGINTNDPALFIPPLVIDPANASVLYFGTNRVYRTENRAELWTPISPAFTGNVSAIAPAATDPLTVYAGTSAGQLQVTVDGGESWTLRNAGLPPRSVTDIAVDRGDARTAYVSVSGFGTQHLFRTTNGGQTWTSVSNSLPDMPINAIALDPATRAYVMIGTDLGVFVSSDSGTTWTFLNDGMPNVAVFDIAYAPATGALIAATHGRGMFQLQLDRALTIAAVPQRRRVNVLPGAGLRPDSAAVVLSGIGAGAAAWTATHSAAASWVTLTSSAGTGSGTVRWTRNLAGLAPGFHVDTIRVTSPGAVDSPASVIDTVFIEGTIMSVEPGIHTDTVLATQPTATLDSALVTITGSTQPAWTAIARQGTWLSVLTPVGAGTGYVRWSRKPAQMPAGVFVDTIDIAAPGVVGSPAAIIDTLVVRPVIVAASISRRDTLTSGSIDARNVSMAVTIAGDPAATMTWSATHGAGAWITVTTSSGRTGNSVAWTKRAFDLRDGVFIDTVTVTVPGAEAVRIVDTLVVVAPPVMRDCVTTHLLGGACLDATQLRWLDLAGNRDGIYNLGDLLSYLARPAPLGPPVRRRNE